MYTHKTDIIGWRRAQRGTQTILMTTGTLILKDCAAA
jgi:hypothetical protein